MLPGDDMLDVKSGERKGGLGQATILAAFTGPFAVPTSAFRHPSGLPRLPGKDGPGLGLDDPKEMNGPDVVFILGTFLVRE